jgi:hypothetical protein
MPRAMKLKPAPNPNINKQIEILRNNENFSEMKGNHPKFVTRPSRNEKYFFQINKNTGVIKIVRETVLYDGELLKEKDFEECVDQSISRELGVISS